jgi:hypothetical protein
MKPTLEQEKELLLLAAKAIGIEGEFMFNPYDGYEPHPKIKYDVYIGSCPFPAYWNPYRNAEQLNEMCAELGIDTEWDNFGVWCLSKSEEISSRQLFKGHESKSKAAAWAALRVAAEIWRIK